MPGRLVEKISAQLHLSDEEVSALLSSFVAALRDEVDTSGQAVVPGIGAFRSNGNGLEFVADDELVSLVNIRFSGLQPVEVAARGRHSTQPYEEEEATSGGDVLSAAAPSPAGKESVDNTGAELDDESAATRARATDEVTAPEPVEAPPSHPEETGRLEEDEADDLEGGITAASVARPEPVAHEEPPPPAAPVEPAEEPEVVESAAADERQVAETEVVEPDDRPALVPPQPGAPADRGAARRGDEARKKKSAAPWMILGLVLILVAAVGLFMFLTDDEGARGPDAGVEDIPPVAQEEPPVDEESEQEAAEDDGTAVEEGAPGEAPAPASQPEPMSPVYGESIERDVSRYTLVVASLPNEESAREEAEAWRRRGFRTGVFSEATPAGTRYRVAIGQFVSIQDADSVRSESDIASEFPEGTWVYRYPASPNN